MLTEKTIEAVIALVTDAGKEILRIYNEGDYGIKIKDDDSPVTRADLAADEIIKQGLALITPDIPVFSEETKDVPYELRSKWSSLWILDPLDGTKEFIARTDEFCVSLGLVENGIPVAGFIYSPVSAETWVAEKGKGAYRLYEGIKTKMPFRQNEGPIRVNKSRTHHTRKEEEWIEEFKKEHDIAIEIYGSAVKFCKIAEGLTDLYPKMSPIHEWDIAAGHLIVEESGGHIIETETGKAPVYNKPDYHQPPFIAFGPRLSDWEKWVSRANGK